MVAALKYYGPAILWALFILLMCGLDLSSVSHKSIFFPGFDKLTHCGFFFVLVVFWCSGLIRQQFNPMISYKEVLTITVVAVLYGGLIELLQLWVFTWRSAEWNDLFADTVGASMAAFSVMVTIKSISYVKK